MLSVCKSVLGCMLQTEVKHVVVEGLVKTKGDIVARQIWNIIKATNLYEVGRLRIVSTCNSVLPLRNHLPLTVTL